MTSDKARVLEALKYIRDNGPLEGYAYHGICAHLVKMVPMWEESILKDYYVAWRHFSGDFLFPVPAPDYWEGTPEEIFSYSGPREMWDKSTSEYAVLRYDLIDHLIECIEGEEKELQNLS